MFSSAVSVGMSWNDWKTNPIFSARKPSAAVLVESPEVVPVEVHGSARGAIESREQAQQRRLPAAGWANDRHERAGLHLERDIVQHGERLTTGHERFCERGAT